MVLRRHLAQSDNEEIITDAAGAGSVAVTLKNPYPHLDYAVVVTPQEADNAGKYEVVSKTKLGFTIGLTGSERKSAEALDASSVAVTFNDNTKEVIDGSGETVTFAEVGATGDTITRATGGFSRYLADGDEITIAGSASNDGTYTIATVTNTVITMGSDDLAAEVFNAGNLTITPSTPTKADTVIRASGDWDTIFNIGDIIIVSDDGSDVNAGTYTITDISTVTMTLTLSTDSLTQEANTTDTITFVNDRGIEISWMAQRNS